MSRPNEYTRGRFITMQVVMWGVLLCTVGVAALASRYKRGSSAVTLGEPQLIDSISVRLPKGWKINDEGSDGVRAVERTDPSWRRVIVVRERDPESMTLLERFMSSNTASPPAKRNARTPVVQMGPTEGVLNVSREVVAEDGTTEYRQLRIVATSTLPNQHILTISLIGLDVNGEYEPEAIELVKKVAASVQYLPAKELK